MNSHVSMSVLQIRRIRISWEQLLKRLGVRVNRSLDKMLNHPSSFINIWPNKYLTFDEHEQVSFIFRTHWYRISRERCEIENSCQQKTNKELHMHCALSITIIVVIIIIIIIIGYYKCNTHFRYQYSCQRSSNEWVLNVKMLSWRCVVKNFDFPQNINQLPRHDLWRYMLSKVMNYWSCLQMKKRNEMPVIRSLISCKRRTRNRQIQIRWIRNRQSDSD